MARRCIFRGAAVIVFRNLIVFLSVVLFVSVPVQASSCPKLTLTGSDQITPTPEQFSTVKCWADKGHALAAITYAGFLRTGTGTPADPAAARAILLKLAKGGIDYVESITSYRDYIAGQNIPLYKYETGQRDRPPEPAAMREYAKMLLLAQGGPRDVPLAKKWLKQAISRDDKEAAILLAKLEANGY
jgi:hypothetical protein